LATVCREIGEGVDLSLQRLRLHRITMSALGLDQDMNPTLLCRSLA
jgi:hypothetical protein